MGGGGGWGGNGEVSQQHIPFVHEMMRLVNKSNAAVVYLTTYLSTTGICIHILVYISIYIYISLANVAMSYILNSNHSVVS